VSAWDRRAGFDSRLPSPRAIRVEGFEAHEDFSLEYLLGVDLREGRQGFDFLGCHFHARMSGKLCEQRRIVRYYLHRWPSVGSMKRARARVKAFTCRSQVGMHLPVVIERLNLFLRGWGNYFRTGNETIKFVQMDSYVAWRLRRLLIKKRGRNLRAGQADKWTRTWFRDQGLHQLIGTIRYPKGA
jgi:RNA-directed DNA polymerase